MKKVQLLAASALTMFGAVPAFAQDTPAQTYDNANDIVINATRRDETVQDVPIAVTAVPADVLTNAGVQDVRGLEQLAPSLQTTTGQSAATGSSFSIRGIGTAGDNPGFEPAVGIFIDGVFRARAGVALAELPELDRVEILRGPQGTLFGRNTSAGAISIFTAQPQFDFGGHIEGSYGNYNAFEINGSLTGPVAEQFALRVDAGYRQRDGYILDANSARRFNNIDRWNVRGQALFDNGDVTFRLIADYAETNEQCCGAISIARGAFAPLIQGIAAAQGRVGLYTGASQGQTFVVNGVATAFDVTTEAGRGDRRMAVSPNRDFGERVRDWGISGELNWELGDVRLTSITAYRSWRVLRDQDIDFSGIDRAYRDDYRVTQNDFTQEFRLQGSAFGGALDWLVGAFYLNESLNLRDTVRIGNDGNRYVDSIFNALAGPAFGGSVQFFGTLGAAPTPGAALLNPAVPNALAAYQAVYGAALAPIVGCFRTAVGTAPGGVVPVATCNALGYSPTPVPGLAALAVGPLPAAVPGQGNNNDDFRVRTDAFALFTHNIINITDNLSLTIGARYNIETKRLDARINNNLGSCGFFDQVRAGNAAATQYANLLRQLGLFNNLFLLSCNPAVNSEFNGNYNDRRRENRLTGTAKLAYKFSEQVLGYVGYDRGYKSGGYNLDQATFRSVLLGATRAPRGSDLAFGAETADAWEVGVKTSFSRVFTLNAAVFYAKYSDLQNLVFSGNNFVVQNINSSTSKGLELESIIRPSRDFVVRLGYTLLDARYDRSNNFTGTPLAGSEGRQIANQPRHVVTMAMTYTPQLGDNIRGLLHIDARYNGGVNIAGAQPTGRDIVNNPGYPLISARIGLQNNEGTIRGEFFVENLTNQYYNITGFAVPEQTNNFAGYPSTPRFFGVRGRFGF